MNEFERIGKLRAKLLGGMIGCLVFIILLATLLVRGYFGIGLFRSERDAEARVEKLMDYVNTGQVPRALDECNELIRLEPESCHCLWRPWICLRG